MNPIYIENVSRINVLYSNSTHLVCNIQCIVVSGESHIGFLLSIRSMITKVISQRENEESESTHRMRVLIFAAWTSYSFFTASLICLLFDLMSTMKTNVLCSSIFFIALSVFKGLTIVRNWSMRGAWLTLFLGYLGSRGRRRVLGR